MSVFALTALAPAANAALPSTDPNTFCTAPSPDLTKGIYNDAKVRGKFDLVPTSTKVNAIIGFTGGANLCGTKPSSGQYYSAATITYYSGHGRVRCARPNPTSSACGSDGNVADGSYAGSSQSDTYCTSTGILCANGNGKVYSNMTSRTRIRYNTAGPGTDANRCVSPASPALLIACESSEVNILGIRCASDIIITRTSSTGQYKMNLYQPTCSTNSNPMYFLNIDSLTICKGYGTASSTFAASGSCRDTSASYWLSKNGATTGAKTYSASGTMTGGAGTQTASASVTLTP